MASLPRRPAAAARAGRAIQVAVNHFRVRVDTGRGDINQYDVDIEHATPRAPVDGQRRPPSTLQSALRRRVIRAMLALAPEFESVAAVSGEQRLVFTNGRLNQDHFVVRDVVPTGSTERGGAFHVTVRFASVKRVAQLDAVFAGRLDVTPYDVLQALDVVMRHTAVLRLELVGRTLVNPMSGNRQSLGGGVSCVTGYYQSLRPTQSRLTLNVDRAFACFYESKPLIDFCQEVLGIQGALRPPLTHAQTRTLTDALKNVRVDVTHRQGANGGRLGYRIDSVTGLSAEQQTFEDENGREQTVAAFFAAQYTSLQFPKLPCVHVGVVNRKVYLPLEVCFVSGKQRVRAKLSGRQTSSMIRFACVAPQERKRVIETALREDARFQEDPRLPAYALTSWSVIDLCGGRLRDQKLNRFLLALCRVLASMGITTPSQLPPLIRPQRRHEPVRSVLTRAVASARSRFSSPAQLVLCVAPGKDAALYGEVKRAGDVELGVVTQCCLLSHVEATKDAYLRNFALKMNVKLGGINWVLQEEEGRGTGGRGAPPRALDVTNEPTLVCGADVSHPSPSDTQSPSIAALVGSLDRFHATHTAIYRAQTHRVEYVEDMEEMMGELLTRFETSRGVLPTRVLYFRDGVSEGQFGMVQGDEVGAIKRALQRKTANAANVRVSAIVIKKRHHTRFFPMRRSDSDGMRAGNVSAGTVVDSVVCHPQELAMQVSKAPHAHVTIML
ncbi:hypothetical protein Poli38472_005685 [Pythium oligandrum]|uniref:Uncharacterized protein n=1 Tax=Pythium oligandrum TaxID=41045 RepID=A0A8K1CGR0_PYTOL|nr:hypothetical protein Poli38472_005685 [Pythium oligandrum]|eukprot:TMW63067.1 hypothetical protein Poli38472_005685 [Pythium oligandrum]